MEKVSAERRYAQIHEDRPYHDGTFKVWGEKATWRTPYHFSDGVRIFVAETDLNPDDNFLDDPDQFMTPMGPFDQ